MSELPAGVPAAREPEPRDSSSGIVLSPSPAGGWDVLLGLRSRRSRFMPSHLSFPGGVIDPVDRIDEPGAFERCATRELQEETGIAIDPSDWVAAGVRTTPSMFPVRFHTRFFVTAVEGLKVPESLPSPDEIEELRLLPVAVALREWESGEAKIPPPVLPILRAIADAGAADLEALAGRILEANDLEQRSPRIEFWTDHWMLPVRTATLPPATHTNVWIPGGRRFAVIDPGSTEEDENRRLLEVIARRTAAGGQADSIVLTHHHQDHVGGVERIARELRIPVRAHPETIRRVRSISAELVSFGDREQLDLDGVVLRAHHTPGHAPGHLALEIVGTGGWVTGDLVSGLSTILIHPVEGDMQQYIDSLERLRDSAVERLYPGHGPPLPRRALEKLIEHRHERERKIVEQLSDRPEPLSSIATRAYDDAPADLPQALIEGQTLSHLLALARAGRARAVDTDQRMWTGS